LTELSSAQTTSKVSDIVEFSGADLRVPVVEWKFSELDTNNDRVVERKELDRLGRLVKKLVKPTSCAVSFHTRCDLDFDSSLTLQEWKTCFDDDADTNHSAVDGSCQQQPYSKLGVPRPPCQLRLVELLYYCSSPKCAKMQQFTQTFPGIISLEPRPLGDQQ